MLPSRTALLLIALLPAAGQASAAITRCEVQNPQEIDPRWVMFDTATGRASIEYMGEVVQGRVTLTTKVAPWGSKINLVFPNDIAGSDPTGRLELIVFPTSHQTSRMIGVVTRVVDGERHLYAGMTNVDVVCAETGM